MIVPCFGFRGPKGPHIHSMFLERLEGHGIFYITQLANTYFKYCYAIFRIVSVVVTYPCNQFVVKAAIIREIWLVHTNMNVCNGNKGNIISSYVSHKNMVDSQFPTQVFSEQSQKFMVGTSFPISRRNGWSFQFITVL